METTNQLPLRILHLGNDLLDEKFVSEAFGGRGECEVFRVDNHRDFLETIDNGGFDVIFTSTLPSVDRVFTRPGQEEKHHRYTVYFHFTDKIKKPAEDTADSFASE